MAWRRRARGGAARWKHWPWPRTCKRATRVLTVASAGLIGNARPPTSRARQRPPWQLAGPSSLSHPCLHPRRSVSSASITCGRAAHSSNRGRTAMTGASSAGKLTSDDDGGQLLVLGARGAERGSFGRLSGSDDCCSRSFGWAQPPVDPAGGRAPVRVSLGSTSWDEVQSLTTRTSLRIAGLQVGRDRRSGQGDAQRAQQHGSEDREIGRAHV